MIQKVENKTIEGNVTQTVKLLMLLFFIATSLFAQTNKSITLVRNQTDTTFFVYSGDLTSATVYLTAKKDSKISSPRLIDHLCDSISYSGGLSTLYFYMLPVETSGIDLYRLRYDVMIENSSTSHTILFWGDLNLKQGVRLDSDDAPTTPTPIISYNLADSSDSASVISLLGINKRSRGQGSVLIAGSNAIQTVKDNADFVCDGIDDQVQFNQAIQDSNYWYSANPYSGHQMTILLEGTYYFSDSVLVDKWISFKGMGRNRTHIQGDSLGINFFVLDQNTASYICEFDNIKMDGNGANNGILMKRYTELTVRGCEFREFNNGIVFSRLSSGWDAWCGVFENWFLLNDQSAISFDSSYGSIKKTIISGNKFWAVNRSSDSSLAINIKENSQIEGLNIDNNHFWGGKGILVSSGSDINITNNMFSEKKGSYGIKFSDRESLESINCLISGNNFTDELNTYKYLIDIGVNCDKIDIMNNRLYGESIEKIAGISNMSDYSIKSNSPNLTSINIVTNLDTVKANFIKINGGLPTSDNFTITGNIRQSGATNSQFRNYNGAFGASKGLYRSRGTYTTPTANINGDIIAQVNFGAHDGTNYQETAHIKAAIDGAVSVGSVPTFLGFNTGSNNFGVERMRITSDGKISVGGSSTPTELFFVQWATNVTAGFFRGTTDTDITGTFSRSPNGTLWYQWIDDSGTVQTSTTKP